MFRTKVRECLSDVYEASGPCNVSVDHISRLAQFLRLETFIDKIDYASSSNGKRLSIAGQLILIDIDCVSDNEVVDVLMSRADHTDSTVDDDKSAQFYSIYDNTLTIDMENSPYLLFTPIGLCSTRNILRANLSRQRLGNFTKNLRYLANIDQLLVGEVNTYACLEQIATVLGSIEHVERAECQKTFFDNSVGQVEINCETEGIVGLRLKVWQDWRFLCAKLGDESRSYRVALTVEEDMMGMHDYLPENMTWTIKAQEYTVEYKNKSSTAMNARLTLQLETPVNMPLSLLEYIGVDYQEEDSQADSLVTQLDKEDNADFVSGEIYVSASHCCGADQFKRISKISVSSLRDIPRVISLLRSCYVLENVYRHLQELEIAKPLNPTPANPPSRRPSMAPVELSPEARLKLRQSLDLSASVTNEELLGLRAMSENTICSPEPEGGLFGDSATELPPHSRPESVVITLQDIDMMNSAMNFAIEACINGKQGYSVIRLQNGSFSAVEDTTQISPQLTAFLHALNLGEDFVKAICHLNR